MTKIPARKVAEDTAEPIMDMRQMGASWLAIARFWRRSGLLSKGDQAGPSHMPLQIADSLRLTMQRSGPTICPCRPLQETARKIGCSYGVLRQRIFITTKDLMKTVRTPQSSRRSSGTEWNCLSTLAPQEAAKAIREGYCREAAAQVAAINAKNRQREQVVSVMIEQVRNGKPRRKRYLNSLARCDA